MWNLFTVGSLQFPNDNTIASLKGDVLKNVLENFVKFKEFQRIQGIQIQSCRL